VHASRWLVLGVQYRHQPAVVGYQSIGVVRELPVEDLPRALAEIRCTDDLPAAEAARPSPEPRFGDTVGGM
jgi:hypothetical protein